MSEDDLNGYLAFADEMAKPYRADRPGAASYAELCAEGVRVLVEEIRRLRAELDESRKRLQQAALQEIASAGEWQELSHWLQENGHHEVLTYLGRPPATTLADADLRSLGFSPEWSGEWTRDRPPTGVSVRQSAPCPVQVGPTPFPGVRTREDLASLIRLLAEGEARG